MSIYELKNKLLKVINLFNVILDGDDNDVDELSKIVSVCINELERYIFNKVAEKLRILNN